MQEGQFERVVVLMTAMAAGDTSSAFALYDEFGAVIRRVVRSHLNDLRATVTEAELDGLVLDAVLALLDAAPAWRADGGAMPWTWAERRLRALVVSHVGQWTDSFDEQSHDTAAPPPSRGVDGFASDTDDMESLGRVGADDPLVALLVEALALTCSERDAQILVALRTQAAAGDPSPSNTIAAERGMKPPAVRQAAGRARKKVVKLAQADERFAPLLGLPLLEP